MMAKHILCVVEDVYNEASDCYSVDIKQILQVFNSRDDAIDAKEILDSFYGYQLRVLRPWDIK